MYGCCTKLVTSASQLFHKKYLNPQESSRPTQGQHMDRVGVEGTNRDLFLERMDWFSDKVLSRVHQDLMHKVITSSQHFEIKLVTVRIIICLRRFICSVIEYSHRTRLAI